jgi:hypothetical protein
MLKISGLIYVQPLVAISDLLMLPTKILIDRFDVLNYTNPGRTQPTIDRSGGRAKSRSLLPSRKPL